jgi:hypothetical protein
MDSAEPLTLVCCIVPSAHRFVDPWFCCGCSAESMVCAAEQRRKLILQNFVPQRPF